MPGGSPAAFVRRGLQRLGGRRRTEPAAPVVTVVVTAADAEDEALQECLRDLERQPRQPPAEVLTERYGPSRATTRGAARNAGAQRAQGRYLLFLDANEHLAPDALTLLADRLDTTGSDLAVGGWRDEGDPPLTLTDAAVGHLLFRAGFWRRAGLAFDEAPDAPADLVVAEAAARAGSFDELAEVVCTRLDPARDRPFGQLPDAYAGFERWLATQRAVDALLKAEAPAEVRRGWVADLLTQKAMPYVDLAETATPEQAEELSSLLAPLLAELPPPTWATLPWEVRVKLWLLTHGHRGALASFVTERFLDGDDVPTLVEDGRVFAAVPPFRDPGAGIPDACFELTEEETPLVTSLRQLRWPDEGTLELDVFAYLSRVGMPTPGELVATLDGPDAAGVPLEVVPGVDPAVTRFAAHRHHDYDGGAYRIRVPAETALRAGGGDLRLRLTADGVTRTGTVDHRVHNGTVGERPRRLCRGRVWGPSPVGDRGVRIDVAPALVVLGSVGVSGRTVTGTVAQTSLDLVEVVATHPAAGEVRASLGEDRGFALTLPEVEPAAAVEEPAWRVEAIDAGGTARRMVYPAGTGGWLHAGPPPARNHPPVPASVAWLRGRHGAGTVHEFTARPLLEDVRLEADTVLLTLRWIAPPPADWSVSLVGDRVRLPGVIRDPASAAAPGTVEVTVDTTCDEWGLGATTAPSGSYRVELALPSYPFTHEALPVAEPLTGRTPVETVGDRVRMHARQNARGRLVVDLLPPLADDELGPRAQRRLQEEYAARDRAVDPAAVYLQAYTGEVATDSALAIHHELRRTRPELTLYWGVASHAVHLPEGAVPVQMRSRRWYDVLGSAGYLVNNIDFDRWFVKRPGQRYLQTFHGYPAKTMGLVQWRAKRWPPSRIEAELDRTARTWDLILTPVPEMDEHYRREYAYDGAIHDRGYPRDDVLAGPDAEAVRERTRKLLGIEPGQKAVLYAPTFRDHLATAHRSVELVRHLDLEAASEALGPEYVLLMRGHRFHARARQRLAGTRRLLDVTDYPEINDLVLAADAAVLDYSSLRFDFALTGKPMVFLVPDLDLYSGGVRGFLFDYRSTAPGPLLDDAAQVVDALRDLDALRAAYSGRIDGLNRAYQYWQDGQAAQRVVRAFFD